MGPSPASIPQCFSRKHSGYLSWPQPAPGPTLENWEKITHISSHKLAFLLFLLLKLAQIWMYHKHILTFPDYSQHVYEKPSWSCRPKTKQKSVGSCWPLGWSPPQTPAAAVHLCRALLAHWPSVRPASNSCHGPASVQILRAVLEQERTMWQDCCPLQSGSDLLLTRGLLPCCPEPPPHSSLLGQDSPPIAWCSLFVPSPAWVVHSGLGIERWPALERLSDSGKAPRKGGMEWLCQPWWWYREDSTATAAKMYTPNHSTRWEDEEMDAQSSLFCPRPHSWKANELPQTQATRER